MAAIPEQVVRDSRDEQNDERVYGDAERKCDPSTVPVVMDIREILSDSVFSDGLLPPISARPAMNTTRHTASAINAIPPMSAALVVRYISVSSSQLLTQSAQFYSRGTGKSVPDTATGWPARASCAATAASRAPVGPAGDDWPSVRNSNDHHHRVIVFCPNDRHHGHRDRVQPGSHPSAILMARAGSEPVCWWQRLATPVCRSGSERRTSGAAVHETDDQPLEFLDNKGLG